MFAHRFAEGPKCRVLTSLARSAACKPAVTSSVVSPRKPHFLLDQMMGKEIFVALGV
jgi:hypothetical protein